MREVRQAIVLVDAFRRPSRRRNTAGRYRVGAKTEKEAEQLVQKAIGFGSVKFYYWESNTPPERKAAYKQVVVDTATNGNGEVRHACSPLFQKILSKEESNEQSR